MKQIVVFLTLASYLNLFSQSSFNSESYRVTLGDIETNIFKKDTTANALVIFEQGNSYVDPNDYDLRTEVKYKIKILNREGFDKATVSIPLFKSKNSSVRISDISATTYNKINGEVIKSQLDENAIFKEKHDDHFTLVKFTLPNIKPGSVITYSYKLKSPFMYKYKEWEFQSSIPKLYSEYKTSIPANWLYHIKLVGFKKLDIETSEIKKTCLEHARGAYADCSESVYAMKDIPAFIEEDYMTTKDNYLARIEYELETFKGFDGTVNHYTKSWEDVDREIRTDKEIGKQLKKKVDPALILNEGILNEVEPLIQVKSVYNHIQNNYTWNNKYRIFKDVSIKNLIQEKSGNVSSINILLHNILKELGHDVNPVLASTRNHGHITKMFPVISDFNYLIVQVKVNGKAYLLDATDPLLNFGQLPFRCLNSYGRLMDFKNGSSWIDIATNKSSLYAIRNELTLTKDKSITGSYSSNFTGQHGLNHKKRYKSNSYLDKLRDKYPNVTIENFNVDINENFKQTFDFTLDDVDFSGQNLYLNPFTFPIFKENPFKLQERTYPIDFGYKDSFLYSVKINFDPKIYDVIDLPKKTILKVPNNVALIVISTTVFEKSINLNFKLDFKEPIYSSNYYPYLKELLNKAVDLQTNSLIVLKKR